MPHTTADAVSPPTDGERRTLSRTLGCIGLHLEPLSVDYILFVAQAWARLADDVRLAGDNTTAMELIEVAYLAHDLAHPVEAAGLPADVGEAAAMTSDAEARSPDECLQAGRSGRADGKIYGEPRK
jgi:hypothetical protein